MESKLHSIGKKFTEMHRRAMEADERAQSSTVNQLVTVGATLLIGIVVMAQIADAMPNVDMFNSSFDTVVNTIGSAFSLGAILPLVIVAGAVLFWVRTFGGNSGGGRR